MKAPIKFHKNTTYVPNQEIDEKALKVTNINRYKMFTNKDTLKGFRVNQY